MIQQLSKDNEQTLGVLGPFESEMSIAAENLPLPRRDVSRKKLPRRCRTAMVSKKTLPRRDRL
jgi:hypothetical protein